MQFQRTIGVDYSGAETADSSLKGLRVYMTEHGGPSREIGPPRSPKRYWTRRALAEWLTLTMAEPIPTIAGIDHGFSFPDAYFEQYRLPRNWDLFLDDFCAHWPTDEPKLYVDFLRLGPNASGAARSGKRTWRRHVEVLSRAKSVFHFDVQGQVAKSTHAGLPFLKSLRRALPALHCWPFDGWRIAPGQSCLVEVYPRLYSGNYPNEDRTSDQHDAYATAAWLRDVDADGRLASNLHPNLSEPLRERARYEGWILGVIEPKEKDAPAQNRPVFTPRKSPAPKTTQPGYRNRNGEIVIRATGHPGTDHNQIIYQLACDQCGLNYGANGSDIHSRKCPSCGGGRPGLTY